jgi:hypothetical protein
MRTLTCGNPYILGSSLHGIQLFPGLKTLADDFERFAYVFSMSDSNYKKAFILNNKLFARQDGRLLTTAIFQQNNPFLDMEKIVKLKYCDIFQDNGPYSLDELCAGTGINFSLVTYMRLHEFLGPVRARLERRTGTETQSINQFLQVKTWLSKKVRKLLDSGMKVLPVRWLRTVNTFFRLTGIDADDNLVGKIWSLWNLSVLPNKIRDFAFKFFNNQLAIITRLSHYVQNRARGCTLCTGTGT